LPWCWFSFFPSLSTGIRTLNNRITIPPLHYLPTIQSTVKNKTKKFGRSKESIIHSENACCVIPLETQRRLKEIIEWIIVMRTGMFEKSKQITTLLSPPPLPPFHKHITHLSLSSRHTQDSIIFQSKPSSIWRENSMCTDLCFRWKITNEYFCVELELILTNFFCKKSDTSWCD